MQVEDRIKEAPRGNRAVVVENVDGESVSMLGYDCSTTLIVLLVCQVHHTSITPTPTSIITPNPL